MDVKIVERDETKLVGMVFYGDPFKQVQGWSDENQIGRLWTRFNGYWEAHPELFEHVIEPTVGYEVHVGTDEYDETREYYVFVGAEVPSFESVPPVTFGKVLEAGTYALVHAQGEADHLELGRRHLQGMAAGIRVRGGPPLHHRALRCAVQGSRRP